MLPQDLSLSDLLTPYARPLINSKGIEFVRQVGLEATREVVYDVLVGRNLRDSTELITRRRLAMLNGSLLAMVLQSEARWPGFTERLPEFAAEQLRKGEHGKEERSLAQWVLGLTGKAVQNVLRDDPDVVRNIGKIL